MDTAVKQHIKSALLATLPSTVSLLLVTCMRFQPETDEDRLQTIREGQCATRGLGRLLQLSAARHTAALVIAKVAAIELPRGEWRELIATLLANMSTTPVNSGLQQATLQALGYVCEEMGYLADDVLNQEQINSILTAVVQVCNHSTQEPG